MAGIYVHIPFCQSRCIYCAFYSTTNLERRQAYVDALCQEMLLRRAETASWLQVDTIYLGGGTPSLLSEQQLHQLFVALYNIYNVSADAEITMECNPDDVTSAFADMLRELPVNRVSMGAQTLDNDRLRFLHRRHGAEQVAQAVSRLRHAGIDNISIDLIYGFPDETMPEWHADIDAAMQLEVEHLSAYALSFEEGTKLWQLLEQGGVEQLHEELQRAMYYELKDRLEAHGFEHYEISNFARQGRRSRHNSSYWNQTPYLGLGAGAHSYDGACRRQWNVDNIASYMDAVAHGQLDMDYEVMDEPTRYNDLIMTALRTCDGLQLGRLTDAQRNYCLQQAERFLSGGWLSMEDGRLRLTRDGLFVSDMVMSSLMIVD